MKKNTNKIILTFSSLIIIIMIIITLIFLFTNPNKEKEIISDYENLINFQNHIYKIANLHSKVDWTKFYKYNIPD